MPDPQTPPASFGNAKGDFDSSSDVGENTPPPPGNAPASLPDQSQEDAESQEGDGEVEVLITPKAGALDELQVTEDEFEWALGRALDLLEEGPEDEEVAALEDVEIVLNGRTFRLEEVAEVEIGGDLTELGPLPDPAEDDEGFEDGGEEE